MSKEKSEHIIVSSVNKAEVEEVERADGIYREWLIGEESESNRYMRRFTMKENAKMPLHKHDNLNHTQYILKGKIKIRIGEKSFKAEKGSFLFIPKNVPHSYENLSDGESKFICIIPAIKDRQVTILES